MICSVPEHANLEIEIWDEHAIVFSPLSGETHLLNTLAYEVLQLLQVSPETTSTLISKLCMIFDVEDKADLALQIQKMMADFDKLGLIESAKRES